MEDELDEFTAQLNSNDTPAQAQAAPQGGPPRSGPGGPPGRGPPPTMTPQ